MTKSFRRRVVLGILTVLVAACVGASMAFTGMLGPAARGAIQEFVTQIDAFATEWYGWIEKFGKLAGFLVTLASGAYAIYQKLYFAEFNMHARLREFQQREETRLKDSNENVGKAVRRPGPAQLFEAPIFTDETLNPVLKQMKWGRRPKADESLDATLEELNEQLDLWENQKRAYELRKAQACLLKGAIAAARAGKSSGSDARKDNLEALGFFQEAFALSRRTDHEALEYVGHQQVRLGEYDAALETFQELEGMFPRELPSLERAKALKFHLITRVSPLASCGRRRVFGRAAA